MKEITVYTNGDSRKINTWSNVPYFFTETLLAKGFKVNRVDLKPSPVLNYIFNKVASPLIKKIFRNTSYNYFRSYIHFINVRHRIKKAIEQYPESNAHVFLTFSFSAVGLTNKPVIQFCDWTYDHFFNHFLNREPDLLEKQSVKREDNQIIGSDLVFPLFPSVAEYMKEKYGQHKVHYIGNVVNSLYKSSKEEVIKIKNESNKLIFVGSKEYIDGANSLINAFQLLKPKFPELSLHIIGMNESDLSKLPANVHCYGYLDKAIDSQRDQYYSLFKEAKLFINTTPKWAAFSASIEAMYFYTPVLITPSAEFLATFGHNIDFGLYCEENSATVIAKKIEILITDGFFDKMCYNAHSSVKEFTWSTYIDKMISVIEDIS